MFVVNSDIRNTEPQICTAVCLLVITLCHQTFAAQTTAVNVETKI